jgi:hypothetical protein
MPDCFSRSVCALAMQLNDEASDEERQQLLPYVGRLACADTAEVEQEREVFIATRLRYCRSFRERLEVLNSALAIGRQSDGLAPDMVRTRLDAVQQSGKAPTSVPDSLVFAKIKALFTPIV